MGVDAIPQWCRRSKARFHVTIIITVSIFVSLVVLGNIFSETSMAEIKVTIIQKRLAKLKKDLNELQHQNERNKTWLLEQHRRKQLVDKVCNKYGNPIKFKKLTTFIVDPKVQNVQR